MPTALELFERHHLAVFRFLRRMGAGSADAEDLTQQVFLRVVKALPGYEARQLERAWVFRIARNVRLDHLRAEARKPPHEALDDGPRAAASAEPSTRLDLGAALAGLDEAGREAFLMREVGGLSYVEIAGAVGATPDAVRSRIHRVRTVLRRALGGSVTTSTAEGREE